MTASRPNLLILKYGPLVLSLNLYNISFGSFVWWLQKRMQRQVNNKLHQNNIFWTIYSDHKFGLIEQKNFHRKSLMNEMNENLFCFFFVFFCFDIKTRRTKNFHFDKKKLEFIESSEFQVNEFQ